MWVEGIDSGKPSSRIKGKRFENTFGSNYGPWHEKLFINNEYININNGSEKV